MTHVDWNSTSLTRTNKTRTTMCMFPLNQIIKKLLIPTLIAASCVLEYFLLLFANRGGKRCHLFRNDVIQLLNHQLSLLLSSKSKAQWAYTIHVPLLYDLSIKTDLCIQLKLSGTIWNSHWGCSLTKEHEAVWQFKFAVTNSIIVRTNHSQCK